jgi:hypothetical protein
MFVDRNKATISSQYIERKYREIQFISFEEKNLSLKLIHDKIDITSTIFNVRFQKENKFMGQDNSQLTIDNVQNQKH